MPARRNMRAKCGAKARTSGEPCMKSAGWGTNHVGIGKCKYHGGNIPTVRKNAIVQDAVKFMGAPKDINPLDAIIWCIRITAGEVEWLSRQIAEIDEQEWIEHTPLGKQMHVLQRTRADAQDRLVRYSKDAITLGLAERAIRLAEQFGATIARLLEGVAADLELVPSQRKAWPSIVRKHLVLLESAQSVHDDDRRFVKELTVGSSNGSQR